MANYKVNKEFKWKNSKGKETLLIPKRWYPGSCDICYFSEQCRVVMDPDVNRQFPECFNSNKEESFYFEEMVS